MQSSSSATSGIENFSSWSSSNSRKAAWCWSVTSESCGSTHRTFEIASCGNNNDDCYIIISIIVVIVAAAFVIAIVALLGTNISQLWKTKIIFPATFKEDMLVPWRVMLSVLLSLLSFLSLLSSLSSLSLLILSLLGLSSLFSILTLSWWLSPLLLLSLFCHYYYYYSYSYYYYYYYYY